MTKRILVIDDELQTLKLIGLMLEKRGYNIIAAHTGSRGLEKAQTQQPDLIILDIMMPDVDGYEVTRRLRTSPDTADIPIIMFTAKQNLDDKVAGFKAGADDYLTKPVHPAEMVARVEAVLQRSERKRAAQEPEPSASLIGFLGAKGGTGTTTLAVNVAVALARAVKGQTIALAELRTGMASAAFQLGLPRHQDVSYLLDHPAEEVDAKLVEAQLEEHGSGLLVLSGQIEPPGVAYKMTPDHAVVIVQHLAAQVDYLLLDLGIGLEEVNRQLLPQCQTIVVTIEPNRVSITLAQALLDTMTQELSIPRHKAALVQIKKNRSGATFNRSTIEGLLQKELTGAIPPAPETAFKSTEEGIPIVRLQADSIVSTQLRALAEHLIET
jgi:pilus assembly protein CpaE